jgi:hypothetical protein
MSRADDGTRTSLSPRRAFARIPAFHLHEGTRGKPDELGVPWRIDKFADAVGRSTDAVRSGLYGRRSPPFSFVGEIEKVLFGSDPRYDPDRRELLKYISRVRSIDWPCTDLIRCMKRPARLPLPPGQRGAWIRRWRSERVRRRRASSLLTSGSPPCRSSSTRIAATTSRGSGTRSPTGLPTRPVCVSVAA